MGAVLGFIALLYDYWFSGVDLRFEITKTGWDTQFENNGILLEFILPGQVKTYTPQLVMDHILNATILPARVKENTCDIIH